MKFGIMTRNRDSWSSTQLQEALARHGVSSFCFSFQRLLARVGYEPYMYADGVSILDDLDALLIRPIGRGSLEEIIFRMNMLRRLQRLGLYVINPPEAVEHCADKYNILAVLEEKGIPVPRTAVTENANDALKAFHELGGDVVVKPVFGSRGVGLTRITDQDIATTIFRTITFYHGVIYLQEFVHHGSYDLRVFVIGGHVEAAMKRVANTWKTNYSQGAQPVSVEIDENLEEMAIKSASSLECKIAGVDILESSRGPLLVEVNSQPGWKGLQSVTNSNIADDIIGFILSELKR